MRGNREISMLKTWLPFLLAAGSVLLHFISVCVLSGVYPADLVRNGFFGVDIRGVWLLFLYPLIFGVTVSLRKDAEGWRNAFSVGAAALLVVELLSGILYFLCIWYGISIYVNIFALMPAHDYFLTLIMIVRTGIRAGQVLRLLSAVLAWMSLLWIVVYAREISRKEEQKTIVITPGRFRRE